MKLQEVLKVCEEFINHPENEEEVTAYNDMLQHLTIRSYLSIQEKVVALVRMVIDSDKNIDVPEAFFTAGVELACCFDGLLAYTNIEQEINIEIKNYENYDLIYQSGLADYILGFCEKDYDRLVRMMERTLSYQNLAELLESMKAMDTGVLRETTNEIKKAIKEADPEMIKDMADLMRLNDPTLNDLKVQITSAAVEDAMGGKEQEE